MTEPTARAANPAQRALEPDQRTTQLSGQKRNDSGGFAALLRAALGSPPKLPRGGSPQPKKTSTTRPGSDHQAPKGEPNPQLTAAARDATLGDAAEERPRQKPAQHASEATLRDPLERSLAQAYPISFAAPPPSPETPRNLMQLDPNLAEMIRKVAWGKSDGRSTLRLELGGSMRGGVLLLGAEGGRVSVSLELPATEDASAWQARLRERLEARGLNLEALEVR
ncbi:MAG: hypothetical protein AB7K71_19550 [Polyangiaceae bacterium]